MKRKSSESALHKNSKLMKIRILWALFLGLSALTLQAQPNFTFKIQVDPSQQAACLPTGRLLIHLTKQKENEPRNRSECAIGFTTQNWNPSKEIVVKTKDKSVNVFGFQKLKIKPGEKIYYQVVYKQNENDGQENVAGNLYSEVDSIVYGEKIQGELRLQYLIPESKIVQHRFVKSIQIESKLLSNFFGKPKKLKASILLPSTYYDNPGKSFPICYRASGLNGRWTAVNGRISNKEFMDMWFAPNAPQVIYVYLDSEGPFGDTYQVDSENNGPCGEALIKELIPAVEKEVGYDPATKNRYLAGCSTGGWIVVALQVFYPDFFDGAWSYSPDPLEFEHYGLINIYEDETIFYNRFGYLQPGNRNVYGEPTRSMLEWISNENVNSRTNTYAVSGGQFGAYNAVFGPRGANGLPTLMFDPYTGKVDKAIAKEWEKYDLKKYLAKNWASLGPKLQGKLWIWSGDCDGLFSNVSTRFFKEFIDKTTNPKSDAQISFTAMAGHCQEYSDEQVIKMIAAKTKK